MGQLYSTSEPESEPESDLDYLYDNRNNVNFKNRETQDPESIEHNGWTVQVYFYYQSGKYSHYVVKATKDRQTKYGTFSITDSDPKFNFKEKIKEILKSPPNKWTEESLAEFAEQQKNYMSLKL